MDTYTWGVAWLLCLLSLPITSTAQTEEDEKRPYKFAFAIEGYQHRSEEKDEKGIIMGEYGFVTGDGVYHVTVYATDENGDFKILSMKNFYIGLPGEGKTPAPSTTPAPTRPPPPPPPSTTRPPPPTTKSPILKHLQGLMGCSGCLIPEKKMNPGVADVGGSTGDERFGGDKTSSGPLSSSSRPQQPTSGSQPSIGGGRRPPGQISGPANPPGGPSGNQSPPGTTTQNNPSTNLGQSGPTASKSREDFRPQKPTSGGFNQPPSPSGGSPNPLDNELGERPFTQGGSVPSSGGPRTSSGGPRPIGGDSPPPSGSAEDNPPGGGDGDLLYKFNYTLRYNGHHESGYSNGDKEGDYFVNGEDGLGRRVEYVANEFGYQPNITLEDLGLESPDTPKGEGGEPNELRGYEFKWFYNR